VHGKEVVGTGSISSVQREKNEVREVFEGEMCGLNFTGNGLKVEVGDTLEFFSTEQRARTLS
jgi:translation initiation factor IF-2